MKKINNFMISISIFCAIISFITFKDVFVLTSIFVTTILISVGIRISKNKNNLIPISIMNVWLMCFNIAYLVLKIIEIIDLYHINNTFFIAYFIPFAIVFIYKLFSKKQKGDENE